MPKRVEDQADRKRIGERLQLARASRGWSQERLAESLELDAMTVSRIENGRRSLSAGLALKAAAALGIHVSALLGTDLPPGLGVEEEALHLLRALDSRHQQTALVVLRELARLAGTRADP